MGGKGQGIPLQCMAGYQCACSHMSILTGHTPTAVLRDICCSLAFKPLVWGATETVPLFILPLLLLLGVPCTENDYKLWSPSDERGNECLLGHKTVFKRRTPHATCFNGEDFDRPVMVSNCSCTREDFEW